MIEVPTAFYVVGSIVALAGLLLTMYFDRRHTKKPHA